MSFLKKINNLFNNKKPEPVVQSQQSFQPRKIDFENPNVTSSNQNDKKVIKMNAQESELKIQTCQDISDTRYQNLEKQNLPTLKELGLTKDEIEQGEVAVMVQKKFVFFKMQHGKYEEVHLIGTNYKLCITSTSNRAFIFFPFGKIQKLNKYTNNQNAFKLLIVLKDLRKFKFRINAEVAWRRIYDKIEQFAFIKLKQHFFAFKRFEVDSSLEDKYKGWELYNPVKQFERMKIKLMPHTEDPVPQFTSQFKILDNRDGKICTTYPKVLVVPSRMPYDYLVRCAKFRSRNRMPALTYAYEYQKGKFSSIYRSSQSKVGVQNSRCFEDQAMLRCIGNHYFDPKNETAFVGIPDCKIYDARNYIAALGNKFSGKGYESSEFYKNIEIEFLNIPNIHSVRESYNKALKAASGQDFKFHINLAQSQWYDYVFLILAGAAQIAKNLIRGINNLVHCSDGWDRTAQLCSLSAMVLDPFYRTIEGFQILIEKDWIHFGHQFSTRLGQGMNNPSSEEKSQVFIQFLDCVSQIMHQFPSDFEFNYKLLQEIGELAYSHLFGNFLCNCELQMERIGTPKKTVSLWSHIAAHRDRFLNPFYIGGQPGRILQVSSAQKNMRFFKQHFLQHVEQYRDIYDIYSCSFTDDNLQIMHRQLLKQKVLLQERFKDNQSLLTEIDGEILKRVSSDDKGQVLQKEKEQQIIDQLIIKCENEEKQAFKQEQTIIELKSRKDSRKLSFKGVEMRKQSEEDSDSDCGNQQQPAKQLFQGAKDEYQGRIGQIDPDLLPQQKELQDIQQVRGNKKQEKNNIQNDEKQ